MAMLKKERDIKSLLNDIIEKIPKKEELKEEDYKLSLSLLKEIALLKCKLGKHPVKEIQDNYNELIELRKEVNKEERDK